MPCWAQPRLGSGASTVRESQGLSPAREAAPGVFVGGPLAQGVSRTALHATLHHAAKAPPFVVWPTERLKPLAADVPLANIASFGEARLFSQTRYFAALNLPR